MEAIQLYFEELDGNLYISKTCKQCRNKCKVYSLSECAEVYCKKYKNISKTKD